MDSKRKVWPGTLAIFTMCDEPSARMVAVVTKVTKDKIYGKYLCDRPTKHCDPFVSGEGMHDRCTPLSEFGVEAEIDMEAGTITCRRVGESVAQYEDGKPRYWQDRTGNVGHFDSALRRRWARWALNKQILKQNLRQMGREMKQLYEEDPKNAFRRIMQASR